MADEEFSELFAEAGCQGWLCVVEIDAVIGSAAARAIARVRELADRTVNGSDS